MTPDSAPASLPRRERGAYLPALLILAGVFLIILAQRWSWIEFFGSQVPLWDEWMADARLLVKASRGALDVGEFFRRHFEHILVWSKLTQLACFQVNNQQ